jgi:hypothetical protein
MVQKLFFICFVMLFMVSACKIDRKKAVDRDKFTFKVSNDSFLFFRNVRQIYYDFQDLPEAKWYAYRFSDRSKSEHTPVLTPVIVIDWLNDESYVLLEPNGSLESETTFSIREKNRAGKYVEYSLAQRGRENMLEFASKIYEGIMDENEIYINVSNSWYPLFAGADDRDNFRIVMSDYYRLTNIF